MPKCFIKTLRNYSRQKGQGLEDIPRNHHRTVTRSGRRYVKPALPYIAKERRLGASRCRDRLDDMSGFQRSILQSSPKFKYREKCNPWSQLSLVTRFYLGRQYPALDVTGLKPRERPVWPDDFPCRWSDEEYPLRCDQAKSPFPDQEDRETSCSQTKNASAGDSQCLSPNPSHICPVQSEVEEILNTPKELTSLRLRPERKSKSNIVFGPFRLDKSVKDLKLSQVRSLSSTDGKLLAKVFTIKQQSSPANQTNSDKKAGVVTIQVPLSMKGTLTTPLRKGRSPASSANIRLVRGESSAWDIPSTSSATDSNTSGAEALKLKEGRVSPAFGHKSNMTSIGLTPTSEQAIASAKKSPGDHSMPVIKIISTDKMGRTDRHYKCAECGRVFTVLTALTSHMRTHARQRNKCDECGKVFTRSWLLKGHMRTHTGERPFTCPEPGCDKAFADKSNLRSHLLIHTVTTKSFVCQKCGRAFAQKRYLHKHMLEVCRLSPETLQ